MAIDSTRLVYFPNTGTAALFSCAGGSLIRTLTLDAAEQMYQDHQLEECDPGEVFGKFLAGQMTARAFRVRTVRPEPARPRKPTDRLIAPWSRRCECGVAIQPIASQEYGQGRTWDCPRCGSEYDYDVDLLQHPPLVAAGY